jgi:glycosyltransferase involved in cell wall biosynthesis
MSNDGTASQAKGRFSVILPYYNGRDYIQEAVDSILGQTYKNLELLLVDDGSPSKIDSDRLVALVDAAQDPRVKYHRKNNGGLADARNFGIEKSEGEFVAFIDQDDVWDKDKLRLQAEVFDADAGVQFICTDAKTIGEQNEEMRIGEKWGYKGGTIPNTVERLAMGDFVAFSSVAFRRRAIAGVGGSNRAYVVVPDYEYVYRFAEKMDFYFIAKSLVHYRLHAGNTSKQRLRRACEIISVLYDRKPRGLLNRVNLTVHFLRCFAQIGRLWLDKAFKKS